MLASRWHIPIKFRLTNTGNTPAINVDFYADMRPYMVRALQALANLYDRQGRSTEAAGASAEAERLASALQVPA